MLPTLGAVVAATFGLTTLLCIAILRLALKRNLVDVPNERSLHTVAVPRLGGVAIVLAVWLATAACIAIGLASGFDILVALAGASAMALLGLVDDLRPLPALPRLAVQSVVAAGTAGIVLRDRSVTFSAGLVIHAPPVVTVLLATLLIVATTNIFNFMDGMDGLSATQTVCAGVALGVAAAAAGHRDICVFALLMAAGGAGFFIHNAPPAAIFLGDAGSTFLGFWFATAALVSASRPTALPLTVLLTALAPFLLDGTFTLVRRMARGERVWRAHRTHLYQRAVGSGLPQRLVLVAYCVWSSVAAAEALLLVGRDGPSSLLIESLALAGLPVVWRWVVLNENRFRRPLVP